MLIGRSKPRLQLRFVGRAPRTGLAPRPLPYRALHGDRRDHSNTCQRRRQSLEPAPGVGLRLQIVAGFQEAARESVHWNRSVVSRDGYRYEFYHHASHERHTLSCFIP
jgi:hypothetical protein